MYKVIFSDMDATLLTNDKTICKRNIDAINKAKEKGVKFVLCTGRVPFGYTQFKEYIDIDEAISTNGTKIFSNGKVIKQNYLTKEDALAIINYAIENDEYLRVFTDDCLHCVNHDKCKVDLNYYKEIEYVTHEQAIELAKNGKILKMGFWQEHNRAVEIKNDLTKIAKGIKCEFSGTNFLDVIIKGDSKGEGVKTYCDYNNIDLKEAICIGDQENDHSMLKIAGLACCPKNATEETKIICDYVANADNNEGAVAEIIEKFIL